MERRTDVPFYLKKPFVKVLGGVGTFFQEGSDKKSRP